MVIFISCIKGPEGPAGATGPQGEPGVASQDSLIKYINGTLYGTPNMVNVAVSEQDIFFLNAIFVMPNTDTAWTAVYVDSVHLTTAPYIHCTGSVCDTTYTYTYSIYLLRSVSAGKYKIPYIGTYRPAN
jgi:hypothetical protein